MNNNPNPLIIAFVGDLMFSSKISNVVSHLGYRVTWIEQADDLTANHPAQLEAPGESLLGRKGALFEQVVAQQPALLLFDLTNESIPWLNWIATLKSSPATRRIPIMAFGPHEDVALMQSAKSAGANFVFARSRFFSDMPALLQKHIRVPDHAALAATCQQPLPPLVIEGLELFNQGEYYKCHDALEEAWKQDSSPGRELYRGILQVGIAYYQIQRGNYRGAVKMLLRVRQWLDPLPAWCRGIHVAKLRQEAAVVQEALTALGAAGLAEFDHGLFQPIEYEVGQERD